MGRGVGVLVSVCGMGDGELIWRGRLSRDEAVAALEAAIEELRPLGEHGSVASMLRVYLFFEGRGRPEAFRLAVCVSHARLLLQTHGKAPAGLLGRSRGL